MYSHPNTKHVNIGEEEAIAATSSSPSLNLPDNDPMPASWFSDEDDFDTDSNADLYSNPYSDNDTQASSPSPIFSTSSHGKAKALAVLPPTNPFSPSYKPAYTPTPSPRPVNPYYTSTSPSPAPALTPTPAPRPARSSELLSARIASYETLSAGATARASTGTTARSTTGANPRAQSPSLDKATRSSSASPSLGHFYNAVTQKFPAPRSSSVNKPDYSQEPRIAPNETLSARPTTGARSPSREKGKGRRPSSVSSQLSPFADFYNAATKKFPPLYSDAALEPDYSQQFHGSPGPSRERRIVLSELEEEVLEEDDDEEEDEEPPSPRLPPLSHFQIGGDDGMTAFTVDASSCSRDDLRLLSWERGGMTDPRFSCVSSAPSCLDLSDAQRVEEARLYWDDVLAELDDVADDVVLNGQNDPSYPRVNSEFSRSKIPPRDEHSEPPELSERKVDREEVLRVYLDGFPKYEVNNVFFDHTERLNEEAKRRAMCIDDPDAETTPLPTCVECKNLNLPLHERLSNMLPSPNIFTAGTYRYRPRDHSLRAIEMASTAPDLELRDDSLRARGFQYSENRKVIERALEKDRILKEAPNVADALKCQYCHSLKASGSMSNGPQDPADVDTLRSLILGQQELRRDIERLEAGKRGIQASISTLNILPIHHRLGNALQRSTLAYKVDKLRKQRLATNKELSDAPVDEPCLLDHELYRALASLDPIAEHLPNTPSMSIATANLATGETFPFVDQAGPRRPATRRSSSVYSDRPVRLSSGATTPHAVLEESEFTDGGDVPNLPQPGAQDRAAAYRIMQSVQTYHNSGRTSQASVGSGPMDGEPVRTGRTKERRRQEDVVVTSPSRYDEERYPKRQNIVQQ